MTEFKGKLGIYKILETEDNTQTLWSEYFDEACHNLSGAYEETIHNYILGCKIPDLITQQVHVSILDVGFGVGVGLLAVINQLNSSPKKDVLLNYYSIELDETLLLWSLEKTLPEIRFEKKVYSHHSQSLIAYEANYNNQLSIQIYLGDGRLTLPLAHEMNLIKPLNAIFQDAFSPKKNPALWSVEWFHFLAQISDQKVQLSTYSSSVSIRKSLILAGWSIENAQGFALKRSMTKANLMGETNEELLLQLARSPSLEINDK